ncbi:MAG: PD-(D/E)XK nuclease family protein [archaeon]|nr:PD-(D/E)XK nuclease family protein [archaeon]MDD2477522.1 PD-(D/E)XK nuclease family protein [Candidatus ainarchaeum sp.]MDD3084821.1 PD-(D/E)XK nuclease family protein [Candidatus ainarchaeum sp.]MDD4221385.1 PD-(D/E)XK nuclease family protein [Candidatus ainarchaeum sp.]MDD4662375.1 PD-(D/E)XK nuclease family protein [Candidatus ainarchaeum sp.]
MKYSHSSMETFRNCPLQFKYNYIIKPDITIKKNIEAFMGSMVHDSLEKLYKDLKYNKLNSIEEIVDYYNSIWKENYSLDEVEIIRKGYTEENYRSLGEKYLIEYYNRYRPFDEGKVLGLEIKININLYDSLKEKNYEIIGYIDRLTLLDDNHIEIGDYKTNNAAKTQQEVDIDKQLALYAIAIKQSYPFVEKIDLSWYFLSAGIKQVSSRTNLQLEALKKEVIETIREIEEAKEKDKFDAKPSALCDWCSYRSICPYKSHDLLDTLPPLPENKYLKEKGVFLIDKYDELTEKKKILTKEVDKDLEDLKEAIIVYSKKNNLDKLFGTNKNLLIRSYDSIKLPEKDSKKREELELLIKNNNFWEFFSDLSYIKISNLLKEDFLSSDFKKEILKYISLDKIYRLYLNKK